MKLNETAKQLVAPGKGILAADESFGNIEKKLAELGIESTVENRRTYREMLFTTKGIGEFLSGVILFDETIRQKAGDGRSFAQVLQSEGIIPGIKVDLGTDPMPESPEEVITKGLEGLADRLKEYVSLGARFAKWRAVIKIGSNIPTQNCIDVNAQLLAEYALLCQQAGLVPIVEPEVLSDGGHDIQSCEEATTKTLQAVFSKLKEKNVDLSGILLKPNFVTAGKEVEQDAGEKEVADATLKVLKSTVPAQVPGIVFLSGGLKNVVSYLNEINKISDGPWQLSFSFGRELQNEARKAWAGKSENVAKAQEVFHRSCQKSSAARTGKL